MFCPIFVSWSTFILNIDIKSEISFLAKLDFLIIYLFFCSRGVLAFRRFCLKSWFSPSLTWNHSSFTPNVCLLFHSNHSKV